MKSVEIEGKTIEEAINKACEELKASREELEIEVLSDILRLLEVEAPVDLEEDSERILLNIRGDGSGLLIGRKGQTLDALEYLVNKIVHKGAEDKKRIIVDTENYRFRREESLGKLAQRLAEKAKRL